jgi:hypothetical protein
MAGPIHVVDRQAPAKNGFGVTALVLGIIGTVFGFIPLTFFIALPLGVIGTVFGSFGLRRVSRKAADNKGVTIAGLVLSVIALILGIVGAVIVNRTVNHINNTVNGTTSHASDVAISSCSPNGQGDASASVVVTNHSSKASDYLITIAMNAKGSGQRIGTGTVTLDNLAAGQRSAPLAAESFVTAPNTGYVCQVADVTRFASNP